MTPPEGIERSVRELCVRPRSAAREKTVSDLVAAHSDYKRTCPSAGGRGPRRFRLAAAALILVALSGLFLLGRLAAPTYAIGQTVAAIEKARIVHILGRDWNDRQIEIWGSVDPNTGLMDRWRIDHLDDGRVVVSTPRNTFTCDRRANTVRIQDGPGAASVFRLTEFFAGMEQLAERLDGRIICADVTDPATKQKLIELKMTSPSLDLRALIDPESRLPLSITTLRGDKPGSCEMLKHATKITFDEAPRDGLFDFTIPAGAAVTVETLDDPLQKLPVSVLRYCGRLHAAAREQANEHGIRANTQIYLVDDEFNLRIGGFLEIDNDSNEPWTGEIGVGNFDIPHVTVFDAATGAKQQIRLVQHRQFAPGVFRLFWKLDEPLQPGRQRYGIYWMGTPRQLPQVSQGSAHGVRLSNSYGAEVIETFILIVPAGMLVRDPSRPFRGHEQIDVHGVYDWQRHMPEEPVNNTVDVSLSHSGADYSSDYIDQHKGQVRVEVPETFELANIAIAISERGLNDPHRVNKQGSYYQEVLAHFLRFKDHPLIAAPDLVSNFGYQFRDNSICYAFEGDRIVHRGHYSSIRRPDLFGRHLAQLEDFARVSGFRSFYREHLPYYRKQTDLYRAKVPVRRMWTWLEERFPARHDCYRVVFSPLVGGSHETAHFQTEGFSETIMFVSGPGEPNDHPGPLGEALLSRVVFTEIDHNYVNAVTAERRDDVDRAFADLDRWNRQDSYRSAEMTFNEYMTWAVFILYAHDTYDDETFEQIRGRVVSQMVESRKFVRFQEFSERLLQLYLERAPDQSIPTLYAGILDWAARTGGR